MSVAYDHQSTPQLPFVIRCIKFPESCFGSTYPSHGAISRANPASDVPDQLFGRGGSPSFNRSRFPVASIRVLFKFSTGSVMTGSLVRLAAKTLSFLATESPTLPVLQPSQDLSIPTWIELRCSATMIDDTLTILSLEPMRMVTLFNRKSLRALEKSGQRNVPGRKQEVSGVVHSARLCVICQHSPWGTCRIQILATVQTFRQRIFHHSAALVTYGAVTNSKDTTIKLHSARRCELSSLVQCNPLAPSAAPRIHSPLFSINCSVFGPVVVSSSSRRASRSYPPSS